MDQRERLLRDPSAGPALLRWAERHQDPFAEAVALAHLGADPERWTRIVSLAVALPHASLATLDEALSGWPYDARIAPRAWAVPSARPALRLARVLRLPNIEAEDEDDAGWLDDAVVCALFSSPEIENITSLDLRYHPLGEDGARLLAASEHLHRLEHLELSHVGLGDGGARALADAPWLQNLQTLRLTGDEIGVVGAQALANAAGIANLITLDLRHNPLGVAGASALARSPYISGISRLFIYQRDVGPEGARALAASTQLHPGVRRFWRGRSTARATLPRQRERSW